MLAIASIYLNMYTDGTDQANGKGLCNTKSWEDPTDTLEVTTAESIAAKNHHAAPSQYGQ